MHCWGSEGVKAIARKMLWRGKLWKSSTSSAPLWEATDPWAKAPSEPEELTYHPFHYRYHCCLTSPAFTAGMVLCSLSEAVGRDVSYFCSLWVCACWLHCITALETRSSCTCPSETMDALLVTSRHSSWRKKGQGWFFVGQQVPCKLVTTPFHLFYLALRKCRAIYCPLNSL